MAFFLERVGKGPELLNYKKIKK